MNAAHGCPRDTLGGVSVFLKLDERTEWLEADALGGFASETKGACEWPRICFL
jgi:hypothetical protein